MSRQVAEVPAEATEATPEAGIQIVVSWDAAFFFGKLM